MRLGAEEGVDGVTSRILVGDCRDVLRTLADESVHCVVTSPPYWGLRDYGVAEQIGLERDIGTYVEKIVDVFREVRRVLRSDGTLWLNLGDSYAGSGRGGNPTEETSTLEGSQASQQASMVKRTRGSQLPAGFHEAARQEGAIGRAWVPPPLGLKQKDLVGMPWRIAFALQADGWWLRQDIIWSKPNPMPESVTDRCTKAHEYLFLLSKSERYYFDQEAISEPTGWDPSNTKMPDGWDTGAGGHGAFHRQGREKGKRHLPGDKTHRGKELYDAGDERHRTKAGLVDYATKQRSALDNFKREVLKRAEVFPGQSVGTIRPMRADSDYDTARRNKRSVWTVATQPFKEAHFATFPPALIEPCILAGCPEGGTILDPFGGAGTTALVADRLQRHSILIELNPEYAEMARQRIRKDSPLLAVVTA